LDHEAFVEMACDGSFNTAYPVDVGDDALADVAFFEPYDCDAGC
jgi:hypothetical protein